MNNSTDSGVVSSVEFVLDAGDMFQMDEKVSKGQRRMERVRRC
jgi:hypothetical protein